MIDTIAGEADDARHEDLVDEPIVVAYFLAALTFLFISMLAGLLMALQLVHWNPLQGIELLSPGRWRMVHTNAIAYGFLANAFLGALHWAIPRLTLHKVLDRRLTLVHLRRLAVRGAVHGRRHRGWPHAAGRVAGARELCRFHSGPRGSNGAKRPSGSIRWRWSACCWWPSTSWRPSRGPRARCTSPVGTSWPPSCGRF